MVIFSGCGKADSAECPDLRTLKEYNDGGTLSIRARDDISIHNIFYFIETYLCLFVSKESKIIIV